MSTSRLDYSPRTSGTETFQVGLPPSPSAGDYASRSLRLSAALWFLTALAGQWLFTAYSISYYGRLLWSEGAAGLGSTQLPKAYTSGDLLGNLAIVIHLLLVVFIMGIGPLQLVPAVRTRFPRFHRWNGRTFVFAVVISALTGLYMVWIRGSSAGDRSQHLGLSLNAALILVFSFLTVRHAVARRMNLHRQWALRLYLAASGVWFARVGLWLWVFLTGGAGVDFKSFTGPFLTTLSFCQYLLPLAILELYLHAQTPAQPLRKVSMAILLLVLTTGTAIGMQQVFVRVWLPRM